MAVEFGLPLRMLGGRIEDYLGFPARDVAAHAGVVFTDHMLFVPGVGSRALFEERLSELKPGVTETLVHPAVDSPELRAIASDWEARVDDHRMVCADDGLRAALAGAGVTLIGYRALRELARRG